MINEVSSLDRLKCCIRKDIKEVERTGKAILFPVLAFAIAIMILAFTVIFSNIPDFLIEELSDFDIESLQDLMTTLYPQRIRESIGVYSYYIGFFYSLIVILVVNGILPKENKKGRWILPEEQGYKKGDMVLSKCIVYGGLIFVSVFLNYMIYYFIAWTFMEENISFGNVLFLGLIHGINIAFILVYTMLFSVWWNNGIFAALSMIGTVLIAPDILIYLRIGKYLPTYLLTFVYDSHSEYGEVAFPLILNVILVFLLYILAVRETKKSKK